MDMEWTWNGNGLEMDWKWTGNGLELDWKWNGDGVELEWNWNGKEWNVSGMAMEWQWDGSGGRGFQIVGCSKCRVWMAGMIGLAGLADKGTWRELG